MSRGGYVLDARVSLAISMHSNRGVYAILLGSGVSRAAGIPTGWEIILELISRVALLEDEVDQCAANPEAWYRQRFGENPNYSILLEQLAASAAERQQLLRECFEPTEEEREEGRKVPTAAHHAIADLVARGYLRVIVTTNFDRLMEQALEARGVAPTVISTPDAALGALPLAHSACTIVKVHGDYRDIRIMNTIDELAAYEPAVNTLLAQIFDEYGLIVSGWSAEWDAALRAAIERAPTRRFTTYWAYPRTLTDAARTLIMLRQAVAVPDAPADIFFQKLSEDVTSLEERAGQDHLSPDLAARTVKRYLLDPKEQIRLNDLLTAEVDRVRNVILSNNQFNVNGPYDGEIYDSLLTRLEVESTTLIYMFAIAGFWSDSIDSSPWFRAFQRLATFPHPPGNYIYPLESVRRYPAMLASYAAGIGALAAGNLQFIVRMLTEPMVRSKNRPDPLQFVLAVNVAEVLDFQYQNQLPGMARQFTPLSERVWRLPALAGALASMVSDDGEFTRLFDRFEYLMGIIARDIHRWFPYGCFSWRNFGGFGRVEDIRVCRDLAQEIADLGEAHPLVTSGAFSGSVDRLVEVKAAYEDDLRRR